MAESQQAKPRKAIEGETVQPGENGGLRVVEAQDAKPQGLFDEQTFRQLSDLLLLPPNMFHPHERAFAIDVLQCTLSSAPAAIRRQLAQRLANLGDVAPALVSQLITDDDFDVAEPLLEGETCGTYRDIRDILFARCPDRSLTIAKRKVLSSEIAAQIVVNSTSDVVVAMLENHGAQLSAAVVKLACERAKQDTELCEPLLVRPEMYPACAHDLFWIVGRNLRLYILGRFLEDANMVRQIVAMGNTEMLLPVKRARPVVYDVGVSQDNAGTMDKNRLDQFVDAVSKQDLDAAANDLAEITGVAVCTANRIVMDDGGDSLVVAMKAAGATREIFTETCAQWSNLDRYEFDEQSAINDFGIMFDRLSRGQAGTALTYWDWRETGRGPFQRADNAKPACSAVA